MKIMSVALLLGLASLLIGSELGPQSISGTVFGLLGVATIVYISYLLFTHSVKIDEEKK